MKKVVTLALVLLIVLSMSCPAFAAEDENISIKGVVELQHEDIDIAGSIMPRATLALSFSSLGKDGSVYSPETYYIDDGKSKLNIISATWDSQNSEVGIGWYNVSSGILYFTRYSGGSASDEAISSGNVPTGNYKVCLMNLGTEEITGSLQYSVTRAWP